MFQACWEEDKEGKSHQLAEDIVTCAVQISVTGLIKRAVCFSTRFRNRGTVSVLERFYFFSPLNTDTNETTFLYGTLDNTAFFISSCFSIFYCLLSLLLQPFLVFKSTDRLSTIKSQLQNVFIFIVPTFRLKKYFPV